MRKLFTLISVAMVSLVMMSAANASVTVHTFNEGDMRWSMHVGMIVNVNNREVLNSLNWTQEYETEALCNAAEDAINDKVAAQHSSFNNDNAAAPWVGNSINKGATLFTVCTEIRNNYE